MQLTPQHPPHKTTGKSSRTPSGTNRTPVTKAPAAQNIVKTTVTKRHHSAFTSADPAGHTDHGHANQKHTLPKHEASKPAAVEGTGKMAQPKKHGERSERSHIDRVHCCMCLWNHGEDTEARRIQDIADGCSVCKHDYCPAGCLILSPDDRAPYFSDAFRKGKEEVPLKSGPLNYDQWQESVAPVHGWPSLVFSSSGHLTY
jgi:hypothetical protein